MKSFIVYAIPYSEQVVIPMNLLYVEAKNEEHAEDIVWTTCEYIGEILKIEEVEDEEGD